MSKILKSLTLGAIAVAFTVGASAFAMDGRGGDGGNGGMGGDGPGGSSNAWITPSVLNQPPVRVFSVAPPPGIDRQPRVTSEVVVDRDSCSFVAHHRHMPICRR